MPERSEMLRQNAQLLRAQLLMLLVTILLLVLCLVGIFTRTNSNPETGREILCRHALDTTPVDESVADLCRDTLQP